MEFPNEADDASVIDKEKTELTYQQDTTKFILRSRYKTQDASAVAPVQILSQKVELTTLRASDDGLFDAKDYTIFEESNDALIPRRIPGVIKRSLDMVGKKKTRKPAV